MQKYNVGYNVHPYHLNKPGIKDYNKYLKGIPLRVYLDLNKYVEGADLTYHTHDESWSDQSPLNVININGDPTNITLCFQGNFNGRMERPLLKQTDDPYNPQSYLWLANFGAGVSAKYKGITLELNNELDADWYVANDPSQTRNMDGGMHAAMLSIIYDTVKKVDPTCRIAVPGLALSSWPKTKMKFFEDMRDWINNKNGGKVPFDVLPLHIYSVKGNAVDLAQSDAKEKLNLIVPFVQKNWPKVKIDIGEFGVNYETTDHAPAPVAGEDLETTASKLLIRQIIDFSKYAPTVDRLFVYEWVDNGGPSWVGKCGIIKGDFTVRKSLQMIQDLQGGVTVNTGSQTTVQSGVVLNSNSSDSSTASLSNQVTTGSRVTAEITLKSGVVLVVNNKVVSWE